VRFIEVSHNLNFVNGAGWDTHNEAQAEQHVLIRQLDQAFSALIEDLEAHRLLDKTLVAIGTEFGRPAEFDSRGGRGHQADLFTLVLAGGGLNHCGAYGVSDEKSAKIVEHPVSVPDFHATILAAMGVDPAREALSGARPVPLTDGGKPIARLFS
jgi:arylsulfatase A-like enzyme